MFSIVFSSFTKEVEIENPVFREKNKTGFYFCPQSPSAPFLWKVQSGNAIINWSFHDSDISNFLFWSQ